VIEPIFLGPDKVYHFVASVFLVAVAFSFLLRYPRVTTFVFATLVPAWPIVWELLTPPIVYDDWLDLKYSYAGLLFGLGLFWAVGWVYQALSRLVKFMTR